MESWITLFPRRRKPTLADITAFLGGDAGKLFTDFCHELHGRFGVGASRSYLASEGWRYSFGYSGCTLFGYVRFYEGFFKVNDIAVSDRASLEEAIRYVAALHAGGYAERLAEFQRQRSEKTRVKRLAKPEAPAVQLDRCTWPPKVSRAGLTELYKQDAAGFQDEDLADDIGFTLYARCKEAKEIWEIMELGHIKCRPCGAEIDVVKELDARGKPYMEWCEKPVECGCGLRYSYRKYRQEFSRDKMPRGAASAIFDQFILDWEAAAQRGYAVKMRLIDNLVHEFHVSILSGNRGRATGENLIQGSKKQVRDLIGSLYRD